MDCFLLSLSVFTQSGRDGSEEPTVVQLDQGKEEPSFSSGCGVCETSLQLQFPGGEGSGAGLLSPDLYNPALTPKDYNERTVA